MNLSGKATLNPNAAEFIPFALRSPSATISDTSSIFATSAAGKAVLDRSESSISNNSDDEVHQYWRHQLPDDITPDFKVEDTPEINGLSSFSNLSLNDISEGSRYTSTLKEHQSLSRHPLNGNSYSEKLTYPISSYGEYPSPKSFLPSWEKEIAGNNQINARELGYSYSGNSRNGFLDDVSSDQLLVDNGDVSPLDFLASQFPGFAAESLAEAYFANGGDLNLTIEMLTQLELQVDGGLNHTDLNPKASSTRNLGALDFPSLSVNDGQNGFPKLTSDDHQNVTSYRSPLKDGPLIFRSNSSIPSRGSTDFASAVRKMASQDSSIWKFNRNGSSETSIGSSRSSQVLASSYYSSQSRGIFGNRIQNGGSAHASPAWLETGEAVANICSETREEARDHARLRNAYFEQARQAYIIGNKALAKDLSAKGHLHNMYMKVSHGKAQESIYRQRNPEMQSSGRERMIDLHGLHMNEAIHVLKRELAVLRNAACRSTDQRLVAFISVGLTRGSRSPARVPIAVQRYLLEEEGLDYTEPQPGLLRVVIYS